ncbi:MAG: hypothetical protein J2P50_02375 [Hyphomicrobiaceae bacterium]|nr:hypothetical protein [Hyphomicrobiaceae bacterium]
MGSMGIADYVRQRPALAMGGLGLVSGALSAGVGFDLEFAWTRPIAAIFFLDSGPFLIGLFFGIVIAAGLWLSTGNGWALPVLPVTTMYAWSAAIQAAIRLQRNEDDSPHLLGASLAAGAIGAGITHLGCAIFGSELRRTPRIAATCAVGALAGLLLFAGQRKVVDERLLFQIWQPAVAFSIGLGLRRGQTLRG